MLSRIVSQIPQSPWARLVWAGVAALALIQLVAFYRLCASQVARAQAREAMAVQQRNALTDCLDSLHTSTIASCSRQAANNRGADFDTGSPASLDMPHVRSSQGMLSSAVPVSYLFQ